MKILRGTVADCRNGERSGRSMVEVDVSAADLAGMTGRLRSKRLGMDRTKVILLVVEDQQDPDVVLVMPDELLKMVSNYEKAVSKQGDREAEYGHIISRFNFGSQEDYLISLPMFEANDLARTITGLIVRFLQAAKIL